MYSSAFLLCSDACDFGGGTLLDFEEDVSEARIIHFNEVIVRIRRKKIDAVVDLIAIMRRKGTRDKVLELLDIGYLIITLGLRL